MVVIKNKQNKSGFDIFSKPIPKLTEEQINSAESVENKSWILSHMGEDNLGRFGMIEDLGFALQNVGEGILRCILAYDDEPAIRNLALVKQTIESVGGTLEIGDFTVLKEYIEPEEIQEDPTTGMEVA
jgi:hypothetical protein